MRGFVHLFHQIQYLSVSKNCDGCLLGRGYLNFMPVEITRVSINFRFQPYNRADMGRHMRPGFLTSKPGHLPFKKVELTGLFLFSNCFRKAAHDNFFKSSTIL